MLKQYKIPFRILAVALFFAAVALGATSSRTGICLGDQVLASLGLPAWSEGDQGLHYSGAAALCVCLGAVFLYGATTQNWVRTVRGILIALLVLWIGGDMAGALFTAFL